MSAVNALPWANEPHSRGETEAVPTIGVALLDRRRTMSGRGFVGVITALALGGMALLLILNTVLAQGAFESDRLTREAASLDAQTEAASRAVAGAESPQALAARARQLDMVPVPAAGFVRLSDGRVVGSGQQARLAPTKKRTLPPPTSDGAVPPGGRDGALPDPRAEGAEVQARLDPPKVTVPPAPETGTPPPGAEGAEAQAPPVVPIAPSPAPTR